MLNRLANDAAFAALGLEAEFVERPVSFIDVGARNGVHEVAEPLARLTAVLAFEPDRAECQRLLSDPAITSPWASFNLEAIALSNKTADVSLYRAEVPTNHSLLPTFEPFVQRYAMAKFVGKGTITVSATMLDTILFDRRPTEPDLGEIIKLDTQGSEWEVLEGAARCLEERCVAVYSEVWFCQAYENVKQFSEVELLLRRHGFSFYGFPVWRGRSRRRLDKRTTLGRERPFCVDAVFLKDPFPGGPRPVELSSRQRRVLFTVALLLGYPDFALEIGETVWRGNPAHLAACRRLVESWAAVDPAATASEVFGLAERIRQTPDLAIIEAGRFSDRRRGYWDYDDAGLPLAGT
ncbi:MAG: FkbM family methyltransferase [Proteobacteria bacterium]|nr:FkbM family methyltransferase [Pseudomonadota bacterium]